LLKANLWGSARDGPRKKTCGVKKVAESCPPNLRGVSHLTEKSGGDPDRNLGAEPYRPGNPVKEVSKIYLGVALQRKNGGREKFGMLGGGKKTTRKRKSQS